MATITDRPPDGVQAELDALKILLDQEIPKKHSNNLLIATWNIRAFGGLTEGLVYLIILSLFDLEGVRPSDWTQP